MLSTSGSISHTKSIYGLMGAEIIKCTFASAGVHFVYFSSNMLRIMSLLPVGGLIITTDIAMNCNTSSLKSSSVLCAIPGGS
jgi:hypothetical protein